MAHFIMVLYASVLFMAAGVTAQSIAPSNDPLPKQVNALVMKYESGGMKNTVNVAPLTTQIGLGQSQTALDQLNISGSIKEADAHSQADITSTNIAYICCDSNANNSNISPSDIVTEVASQTPKAILLYSLVDSHCILDGSFQYTSILTMTTVQDAKLLKGILDSQNSPTATIQDAKMASSTAAGSPSTDSNGTPTPTTAVAMSILYSITGIITVLFLTIIGTGAIRAHRHPERYGPRGGNLPGRPRQSRAKGLARAMLETLPIVKFGDPEPAKPGSRDIELEDGITAPTTPNGTTEEAHEPEVSESETAEAAQQETKTAHEHGSGIGPELSSTAAGSSKGDDSPTGSLGCSICTEDFEKGEDVRVLPCNHKYHPACIDPWLLNVSGTCPLCRVDLRSDKTDAPTDGAEAPLSPPLEHPEDSSSTENPTQAGELTNIANLRNATVTDRIAALRSLRANRQAASDGPGHIAQGDREQSTRARLTSRLRDRFRIHTTSNDGPPASEAPTSGA